VGDVEAIRALIVAYADRLDAGDFDGVAALFEHATFSSARGGERTGREEVRRVYESVVVYEDGTPRTKHVLGNVEIAVDADGASAHSRCTFAVMQSSSAGSIAVVLTGRYHDAFARVGDEWRFSARTVHPDLIGDLSAHMGAP
jgi:ketosteroid isomerase-like protein